MTQVIVSNQVECLKCGDRPYSAHRHDFKSCKCGVIFVDGGSSYLRRGGLMGGFKELSITLDEDKLNRVIDYCQEMIDSGRNARGIVYGVLRQLRDEGLLILEE